MNNEYEIISHNRIKYLKLFLVNLYYRNSHIHNDFELCLVIRGDVSVYSDRENYQFHKGDSFLFNPFQPQELRATDEQALILSMQVYPKFCSSFFPNITRLHFEHTDLSEILDQGKGKLLSSILLELAYSYFQKPHCYELKCYSLMNVLFLSSIAQKENLSLTHLPHLFKDSLNISFQYYLYQIRFEKAKQLVEQTDMKLIDICMETGFSDTRYLNQMLIKMLDYTPNQYRKSLIIFAEAPADKKLQTQSIQSFLTDKESLTIIEDYQTSVII